MLEAPLCRLGVGAPGCVDCLVVARKAQIPVLTTQCDEPELGRRQVSGRLSPWLDRMAESLSCKTGSSFMEEQFGYAQDPIMHDAGVEMRWRSSSFVDTVLTFVGVALPHFTLGSHVEQFHLQLDDAIFLQAIPSYQLRFTG